MPPELLATVWAKYGWIGLASLGAWGFSRAGLAILKLWKEREDRHELEIKRLNEARAEDAKRYEDSLTRIGEARVGEAAKYAGGLLALADRSIRLAQLAQVAEDADGQ